jgi:Mg-chelatase subunit ChlD
VLTIHPVKEFILIFSYIVIFSGAAAGMDVEIVSYPVQTTVDGWANISVRVLDNATPQNNTPVNFTATLGNLSAALAYTNSSGMAMIRINSTTSGIAMINASAGNAYNFTNVTFLAGEPVSIKVNATQDLLVVGNITTVNLTSYDIYNNMNSTAYLDISIFVSDVLGKIKHSMDLSSASYTLTDIMINMSNVTFTNSSGNSSSAFLNINSTMAGNIIIKASAKNITKSINITYTPSSPNSFSVEYYEKKTVNMTSDISIRVLDVYGNPVNGTTVIVNATAPNATKYNSPIEYNSLYLTSNMNITNIDGLISTLFRTDKRAGDNIINITIGNLEASITILGLADNAANMLLVHTPVVVYANNKDTYRLRAQVADQFLNPLLPEGMPIREQVLFNSSKGSILVPLNNSGVAATLVGPTPFAETVAITVTYKNGTGYTSIENNTDLRFAEGNLSGFAIFANPDTVLSRMINGNHNTSITLIALDEWGHPLPNINVTLNNTNTTLGNLTVAGINDTNIININTNPDGRIQAAFTSKTPAGNATIIASNGSINASVIVGIRDSPFLSASVNFEPTNIASGDKVNVTAVISAEGELPVSRPAASAMLVLDRSGSMDPDYYAGTPLDVVLVIDRSGSMKDDSPPGCILSCQPITDVKNASQSFMNNLVSNTFLAAVSYSTSVTTDIGLTPLNNTENVQNIKRIIDLFQASGNTNMGGAIDVANNILLNGRSYTKKVQIVLTDGMWNTGIDPDIPATNAKNNNIVIYTIGLGSDINEIELSSIAGKTGGKYYHAPTRSDIMTIYNAIAQEISDYDITERKYGIDGFTPYTAPVNSSVGLIPVYNVSFEGYDFDTTFSYNGSTLGEVLVMANGQNITNIPPPPGSNDQWAGYKYDITDFVVDGSNNVSFFNYPALLGQAGWASKVRNIIVYENGTIVNRCSTRKDLTAAAYNCSFNANMTKDIFTYGFTVNDTINDLKAEVKWDDPEADMDLQLKSPSGHIYGFKGDTTGYYPGSGSEYVWIAPLSGQFPQSDKESMEYGIWTVNITGKGRKATANFTAAAYIDKKSAAMAASHAFISGFDASRGDRAGLALYSYSNLINSTGQNSFLLNGSQWVGYFTGNANVSTSSSSWYVTSPNFPGNYPNNRDQTWTSLQFPGATQIRVHFTKIDVERNYDFVSVYDGMNNQIMKYTNNLYGAQTNVWSPWVNGDTIKVRFTSDWSVSLSGFQTDTIETITMTNTTFNLTWNNISDNLDLYLYKDTTLVNYSRNNSGFETLSAQIYSGYNYYVIVQGTNISSESIFCLNATRNLDWQQWMGSIPAHLANSSSSFDLLNNSLNTISADGLTSIDEGMYQANNEFFAFFGNSTSNSTMVLMTDGLDNAGYHSMLLEARRARNNHTVIYTIGFGNNESEVDPVFNEIANITGGKYYFAPDASVLKSIFHGIAANITNFTAEGPTLNLHVPYNYISGLALATANYVSNSSNATTGNRTDIINPAYPSKGNAEPNISIAGNTSLLSWKLPSLNPGEKWGIWYQLTVQGAGYVPLILSTSNITYNDVNGSFITVNIVGSGGPSLGGRGATVNYIALGSVQLNANPQVVLIGEPSRITLTATYDDGNPAIANAIIYSNLGYFNNLQNPLDNLIVSGSDYVNFTSASAGQARINVIASNGNNSVLGNVMVVVRPKGMITIT